MLVSIISLLNFRPTLFDGVVFPDGIDKQQAIDNICWKCAELSVIYSDPAVLEKLLPIWAKNHYYKWNTLLGTTNLEYNPIENYDRFEDWEDGSSSEMLNSGRGSSSSRVQGFEPGELADKESSNGENSGESRGKNSAKHSGHLHGNIGVTTTQEMLEQERRVSDFSIYEVIAKDFMDKFCIIVW